MSQGYNICLELVNISPVVPQLMGHSVSGMCPDVEQFVLPLK